MIDGYFAGLSRRTAHGWVKAGEGSPSLDAVIRSKVDSERSIPIEETSFRTGNDGRVPFQVVLPLQPGDRVEFVDRATRAPLAGGVRMMPRPGWRPRIAIVAPVKSEARRLIEWIAYHRVLGIRQFYLADNGGDDGTSELLQALDRTGVIVRLDWRNAKHFQYNFYNATIPRLTGFADIVAPIDVDEFFRPLDGRTSVIEAVSEFFADPGVIVVGVNWAIYGSSGRMKAEDGMLLEQFVRRAHQDFPGNTLLKCFIRTEYFIPDNPSPHFLNFDCPHGRFVNTRGDLLVFDDPTRLGFTKTVAWNGLRLDHYFVKSREEYDQKSARGSPADPMTTRGEAEFLDFDRNDVPDPPDPELAAKTKAEMQHLRSLIEKGPSWWHGFDLRRRRLRARLSGSHFQRQ